ncbi:MAG: hypothetical protein KDJ52_35310, partial [Anaerolineae bacterium]|nr:hypothetical protein [Anaerolineae bacterium]
TMLIRTLEISSKVMTMLIKVLEISKEVITKEGEQRNLQNSNANENGSERQSLLCHQHWDQSKL